MSASGSNPVGFKSPPPQEIFDDLPGLFEMGSPLILPTEVVLPVLPTSAPVWVCRITQRSSRIATVLLPLSAETFGVDRVRA
jgi:hypothetical protein